MGGFNGNGWLQSLPGRGILLLFILMLPGFLGGWRIAGGETINPHYVERIKDGQTVKHEILLYFGEPQEMDRTPDGLVFTYKSFKDAPAMPYDPKKRVINPQSDNLWVLDENKQVKKAPLKTEGKILRSTLKVRFKPDGVTVMSHEYKEH